MSEALSMGVAPESVPASGFARQWIEVREDALAAIDRVGRSGRWILGEEVANFERELAAWWGIPHAVGVANGLEALEIALRCAGVKPGWRVLTTPLTAFATTLAIVRASAEPVWCDVGDSGGLDLDHAEDALGADPSIRAVVPVHLYGHPLDPGALARLATDHGAVVVEDCAQSAGASRGGRSTGLAGVAAATSFYPTKGLGAMGDGGAVLTTDPEIAERARVLRDYGRRGRERHTELGLNSRLDEAQAAILSSALLPRIDRGLDRRREIAEEYSKALAGTLLRAVEPAAGRSSRHLFPVEAIGGQPTVLAETLRRRGVSVERHYPLLCPEQPAARGLGEQLGPLPVAHRLAARELSLPIHPYLTDAEVSTVAEAVAELGP